MVLARCNRIAVLALSVLLSVCGQAAGQLAEGPTDPVPKLQDFDRKGTIHSTGPGWIRMVTEDNEPWFLKIGEQTLVQVRGEAGPEVLAPGMFVRFETLLAGRRGVRGEVTELRVCSPADGYEAGVREADSRVTAEEGSEVEDPAGPADRPAAGGKTLPEPTARKPRRGAVSRAETRGGLIAGLVRSYSPGNGTLTILAGQAGTIRARVAEKAKVTIDTAAYNTARPGDAIHVTGTYYQRGQASARKVQIELTLPDTAAKRQPPRQRGRTGRPRAARAPRGTPDDGQESDTPEEAR